MIKVYRIGDIKHTDVIGLFSKRTPRTSIASYHFSASASTFNTIIRVFGFNDYVYVDFRKRLENE